ncbi:MAG: T9SS type A sorting domain-containing protein, partial [Candidatus Aegiribacteria sp.]|nr:T9SS type A sorting domain-containing protein [Candidatus Aegiribacteria sp.]MBD3293928.1 T9SS type A sorting domain-containing protein [Candidatus Fermentibacteria bacterium]
VAARLHAWVANPADLAAFSPPTSSGRSLDYLVITSQDYSDSFTELVDYKSSCGIATEMAYIEDILASSPGWDDAERLRNYITDRWELDGISYVLLAGDGSVLPTREIYLYCEGYDDTAPCDLYFSDLDGDWDASGDHQYGQPEDDLDLYSDVAVGRALFDTADKAAIFVERTIVYGQSPPPGDWSSRAMLCGAGLFTGYTGAKVCDSIAVHLPDDWEVNKAYEDLGISDGFTTHIDIIESGTNWNHYAGHGNTSGIYWQGYPSSMMTNSIAMDLTNGDKAGIHHSIGCHPGAFHSGECCAEALWHSAGGGASSVMFNSSYGWGTPPSRGPSEWLEYTFAQQLFVYQNMEIGVTQATAKDDIQGLTGVPLINWVTQENNLLGDPALTFVTGLTGIEDSPSAAPASPLLGPVTPNPAPGSFSVSYSMPVSGRAEVSVYDAAGRVVRNLHSGTLQEGAGTLSLGGSSREPLPAGCYSVVLTSESGTVSTRMVVIH